MNRHGRAILTDTLLIASITKTLSNSGCRYLPANPSSLPLSDSLLRRILSSTSLHPSKKLDFFRWFSLNSHSEKPSPHSYSHMLRLLCRSGFLREALALLADARRSAVVLDPPAFLDLLHAVTRSGDFDAAIEILDAVDESGIALTADLCNPILIALVRKQRVGLALPMFFKLLEDSSQPPPSSVACNELLVGLRKSDMRAEFERVVYAVRAKNGFSMDVRGYNICIHAFGIWGDLTNSMRLFKEMRGSVGPDLCTYNSLLHVLCSVGKVRDALAVYEELKHSGHDPDAFTYRILIQGCCKSYRIDSAVEVFSDMQRSGDCRPDTAVYNTLLDGMLKARRLGDACQLFEKMGKEGVRASSWTYNILIDGLFRNGRAEAGYSMFSDLKKKGQFVDGITYSIVALQLCKEGLLEEAVKLVEETEERGFAVDLVTITSLLIGMFRRGRWDWADRLVKHVRGSNLPASVLRWKSDMEAVMEAPQSTEKDYSPMFPSKGEFGEIMNLIDSADRSMREAPAEAEAEAEPDLWSPSSHMDKLADRVLCADNFSRIFSLSRGRRVEENNAPFDVNMVNTFMSIFLAKGKLSVACKLFEIFSDAGVDHAAYTYNSLMTSFVKKGYFDEAWSVLDAMGESVTPADIATYNVVIQGLGRMGRADLAGAVLDKVVEAGGHLDLVMYNTLINALGKGGRIDRVGEVFKQMRGCGVNPDTVTYNTLIEVHAKAGRLDDANRFLKMMIGAGCVPNKVTDTTLDFLGKEFEKQRRQKASPTRDEND